MVLPERQLAFNPFQFSLEMAGLGIIPPSSVLQMENQI